MQICPECGEENPDRFRLCGFCGATLAVVCSPVVRMWFRRLIEPMLPQTPVLALNEIVRSVELQAHGVVTLDG